MGLVKEDGLLSTTAGSKAPGSSDTPPHRGGGHTSPNRAPREVSCHSCGSRAQGTAQDTGQSLKMGSSSKNPLENPDIDCNSLGCLQISISFIQVRNHLFVSNKWRPAPASFYHMPVHVLSLCICQDCVGKGKADSAGFTPSALLGGVTWPGTL